MASWAWVVPEELVGWVGSDLDENPYSDSIKGCGGLSLVRPRGSARHAVRSRDGSTRTSAPQLRHDPVSFLSLTTTASTGGNKLTRARHIAASDFVVHTSIARRHNPSNLRRDVLTPAVKTANAKLDELGIAPIGRITFHSLRRTYASLRCACGDIRYTANQLGHEDPRFTLRVYAQATKRRDRLAKPQREQYDRALESARLSATSQPMKWASEQRELDDPWRAVAV
jgi:integrase